jgi:hypothetical protein
MAHKPKTGDLRVWWIPQVPMEAFVVDVKTLEEAKLLLRVLAAYDIFQYETNVKPDYTNAGGLTMFDESTVQDDIDHGVRPTNSIGWSDWYDEEGNDIDKVMREENKGVFYKDEEAPQEAERD